MCLCDWDLEKKMLNHDLSIKENSSSIIDQRLEEYSVNFLTE